MRSPRIVYSLAAAAAVLAAVPAATAIGQGLRGPSEQQDVQAQAAVGSGFTYQGRLLDGGVLPTGVYDLRFVLYDSEVGGAQVIGTPIVTKDDVQVTNGLFSTTLDFGDSVFDGEARWIELAVKPGGSGTFTVLNPRQPVMPVPQAMYAQTAGGLSFPAAGDGTSSTGGLLTVTQLGTGSAISGIRANEGGETASGVHGENSGAGSGVTGVSSYQTGTGVTGTASGLAGVGGDFTGRTGVIASGLDGSSTALEVDGPVKVSGSNRFAFVHTPAGGNSFHNITWISSPLLDDDPDAIVMVSQVVSSSAPPALTPSGTPAATVTAEAGNLSGIGLPYAVAAVYIPDEGLDGAPDLPAAAHGRWAIVRGDGETFPDDVKFNIVVIKQ